MAVWSWVDFVAVCVCMCVAVSVCVCACVFERWMFGHGLILLQCVLQCVCVFVL